MANNHLTEEEILTYLDAQTTDADVMALISRVIGHTMNCEPCRTQLALYQETQQMLSVAMVSPQQQDAQTERSQATR